MRVRVAGVLADGREWRDGGREATRAVRAHAPGGGSERGGDDDHG